MARISIAGIHIDPQRDAASLAVVELRATGRGIILGGK